MIISVFNRIENYEKRRKCWLLAFFPYPTIISKAFFLQEGQKFGFCGKELMKLKYLVCINDAEISFSKLF